MGLGKPGILSHYAQYPAIQCYPVLHTYLPIIKYVGRSQIDWWIVTIFYTAWVQTSIGYNLEHCNLDWFSSYLARMHQFSAACPI